MCLDFYHHNILAQLSYDRVWAPRCAWDAEVRETLVAPAWDESLATHRTSRRPNLPVPPRSPVNFPTAHKNDRRIRELHQKAGTKNLH